MYNLEENKSKIKKSSKTDIALIQVRSDRTLNQDYEGKGKNKSTKLRTVLERAVLELFDEFDAGVKTGRKN